MNNFGDALCDFCIAVMEHMSQMTGLSYGLINVLLFIVLGPASTLIFMCASVLAKIKGNKSTLRRLSIALDIIGFLIVIGMLAIIAAATFSMPLEPNGY